MREIDDKIHLKMSKIKPLYWFQKTYKEVKHHYSEEKENNVVEGERENHDNDEYVYYLHMEIAPAIIQVWNGGWG